MNDMKMLIVDYIKSEKNELGGNVFHSPNVEYFKVLDEISAKESCFVVGTDQLIKMAEMHSATYNNLDEKTKSFVNEYLNQFFFSFD